MTWNFGNLGNLTPGEIALGGQGTSMGYTPTITPTGIDLSLGGGLTIGGQAPGDDWQSHLTKPTWLEVQQLERDEQWGWTNFNETVRQFDINTANELKYWEMQAESALQAAQIAASASTGAADINAQARIEAANIAAAAARYNADTAYKISQLDNETKYKIAQEANKLDAMKYESTRFQHPGKWAEQEAWFAAGGAPAIETPTRSVVPQMPGVTPVGSEAGSQAAGWTPPTVPAAPQAIVGEGGPELATATPSGINISPLEKQQEWFLKRQGVPGMQGGGLVSSLQSIGGPRTRSLQTTGMSRPAGGGSRGLPGRLSDTARFRREAGASRAKVEAYRAQSPSWSRANVGAPERRPPPNMRDILAGISGIAGIRAREQGWRPGRGWPDAAGAGAGGAGGGGAGGAGTPVVSPHQPLPGEVTPSVLSYLRGEEAYPSWGGQEIGQFQVPGGANYGDVPLPGSINLVDFLNLPYDMQQMYLSATEATYSMTPQQTSQWMTAFAPRGIASPVATWG